MKEVKGINPEWANYYKQLEVIRRSGITNMYGSSPFLASIAGISDALAKEILCNWITNYDKIAETYWQGNEEIEHRLARASEVLAQFAD